MRFKPLLVLLPGLDGTGRFFEPHLAALSEHYRPLPVAYRSRPPFGFKDLVDELDEATGAEPPGSIVAAGESFGGPVAINFVLAFPERVRCLVLINTFSYYSWRIRIRLGCRLSGFLRWKRIQWLKTRVAEGILRMEGISPAHRSHYHQVVRMIDMDAYRCRLNLVRDVDLRPRLCEITAPTLILAAQRDKIVPSHAAAEYMSTRIPITRVREFPEAGHALLLTPGFSLAEYISPAELGRCFSQPFAPP
jgi:pimeloyl-ACP methyl ester carboxylesterase